MSARGRQEVAQARHVGQALLPAKPHSCGFMPPQAARKPLATRSPRPGLRPADAAESGIAGKSACPTKR